MWKEKTWQYEMTGIDGNTILFGVNIFDYQWSFIKKEIVENKTIDIYFVKIDDLEYFFGALVRNALATRTKTVTTDAFKLICSTVLKSSTMY